CNPCVAALRLPGRMAVEQVARWPWNAWPDESGLGGRMAWNPHYYTSGSSRSLFIGKAEVRLVHAAPMVMQQAGTEVGMAISALFYLGKDGSTPECIAAIKKVLRPEDLTTLMACKMPKWMRMALELT
ncbi:DUF6088 family protein, partial [Pseudomonas aeruginosa]|uniref:DUF6088 family protein n=1 Tax=Pseudomonas aeruginosa TaxID=287 RepID=UPI001E2BD8B9